MSSLKKFPIPIFFDMTSFNNIRRPIISDYPSNFVIFNIFLRHLLLAAGAPPGSSKGLQPHANVMAAKTAASQPLERSPPQAEGILQNNP